MKKAILFLAVLLALPLLLNAWADWQSVANQHFRIYFKDGWSAQAEAALGTLEYYRPKLEQITGNSKGQIPINIQDLGNLANGYTDPVGTRIALFAYPPTSDELAIGEDWWQMVACHEYLHELQITKASGTPALLRLLFGNILYPHLWQPGWMTEGITVYGESKLSALTGRLNGGTYPSTITALAKSGRLPSPTKASYFSYDTPHANHYTYGGAFYEYLTKTYGEDKLAQLFNNTSSSTWSYSSVLLPNLYLDKAFTATFGKDVAGLWADWQAYEQAKNYVLPERTLTSDGWMKSDLRYYNGKIYYIEGKALKTGPSSSFMNYRLCRLDASSLQNQASLHPETVVLQSGEFPAGYAIAGDKLYYTRSEWKRGFDNVDYDGLGSVAELWQMNLTTGKKQKVFSGMLRSFCPQSDGSIVLSLDNQTHTRSTLARLRPGSSEPEAFYEAGGLVYSILERGSNLVMGMKLPWRLGGTYLLETSARRVSALVNTSGYTVPLAIEGDNLVFNGVLDNLYAGYVMNMRTNRIQRISNCSDVRSPVLLPGNRTAFLSLGSRGYDLCLENTRLTNFDIPASAKPSGQITSPGQPKSSPGSFVRNGHASSYLSNIGHLLVPRVAHIPILYGTGDSLVIGALLYGNDAVGDFPAWTATLQYDTFLQRWMYQVALENNFFNPVHQVLGYSNDDDQTLTAQQYMSLYQSQNYGLASVYAGFSFETRDDYSRKVWTPFIQSDFTGPYTNLSLRGYVPLETREFMPSDRNRTGWQGLAQLHQQLPLSSELKASAFVADDPDADADEVFGRIRGYDKDFDVNRGAFLQATVYKPVLKIRQGIWAPQIYIEDINLGVFYDMAMPFDKAFEDQNSYGGEVLAELGLAYQIRMNVGARYGYNVEKKAGGVEVILGTLF